MNTTVVTMDLSNPAGIQAALAHLGSDEIRAEISDYAINSLRERRDRAELPALLAEEAARITSGKLSFMAYLRCTRAGSKFRLDRRDRCLIYAQVACRVPGVRSYATAA